MDRFVGDSVDIPVVYWCESESELGKTSYSAVQENIVPVCLLLTSNDIADFSR